MKAWVIAEHGDQSKLQWTDRPTPVPGPGEVRIKVEAVGLNHLDVWVRKGVPGHSFPLPMIPGCDVAGVIESFGPGAEAALQSEGLRVASHVVLHPGVSCGRCRACWSGFDPLCAQYGILGEHRDGGCAEYIVVPAVNVVARPTELSAAEAAALPIPYLTAWTMVFSKGQLKPSDTILVQAGGSGVSIAAIQLARMIGARVLTTVGSDEKMAQARALGVEAVFNYRQGSVRDQVKTWLKKEGRRGVDVAIDHVGADTFADSLRLIDWGWLLVTCGATSASKVEIDLKPIFFKNLSILGSTMGSKSDFLRVLELVRTGVIKPVVQEILPMREYARACSLLENRTVFGKLVVTMA